MPLNWGSVKTAAGWGDGLGEGELRNESRGVVAGVPLVEGGRDARVLLCPSLCIDQCSFDSNCYIAITRKLDTHDVSRDRAPSVREALQQIAQPALILGIESDGLFTFAEQQELADAIPDSRLRKIDSPEGHDAFLLQFEQVNRYLLAFFREVLPEIMERPGITIPTTTNEEDEEETANRPAMAEADAVGVITKTSTFGEAEVDDLTAW